MLPRLPYHFLYYCIFYSIWTMSFIYAKTLMNPEDSLRSFTMVACDNQKFHIKCPTHTKIFIESAVYGTNLGVDHECLHSAESNSKGSPISRIRRNSCEVNVYEKISKLCQNQEECAMISKIRNFFGRIGGKECKKTNKMLKLVYKCKPSQFMSDNLCENTTAELKCRQIRHKIAIYSAHYGRKTTDVIPDCDKSIVPSDCGTEVTSHALEHCHGQYKCTINVTDASLNIAPGLCPADHKKALHLIHMCVDEKIFKVLPAIVGDDSSFHRQWYPEEEATSRMITTPTLAPTTVSYEQANPLNDAADIDKSAVKYYINDVIVNQSIILVDFSHEAECSNKRLSANNDGSLCLSKETPNFVDILAVLEYTIQYITENKGKALAYFCLSSISGLIFCLIFGGFLKICALLFQKESPKDEEHRISSATVDLLRPLDPLALTIENYMDYEPPYYATAKRSTNVPMRPYRSLTVR